MHSSITGKSQANDRQISINHAFLFLKVQETTVLCGF
nr:MAG TPA: hypothetical protein [Caudoviricetes sp.]